MTQAAILTENQIEAVVKATVRQALLELGFNTADPEDILEYQKDRHYLRAERLRKELMINKAWMHAVGVILTAAAGYILLKLTGYHGPL